MTHFRSLNRVGMVAALLVVSIASALHAQTIIAFDLPNSTSTQPTAINSSGQITGSYSDSIGTHAFLRQTDGTIISFDAPPPYPPQPGQLVLTGATAINAFGQIVGYVYPITDISRGFLRLTDGTFVIFGGDCSGPTQDGFTPAGRALWTGLIRVEGTVPTAINDRGQITGYCGLDAQIIWGFLRQPDGAITVFEPKDEPNPSTRPLAMNSRGQITGVYLEQHPTGCSYCGFLREPDGAFATFEGIATAINSRGQITGYTDHGFLRQPDGSIVTFDVPNAISTQPAAINLKGQITGVYVDASYIYHGFVREKDGTISTFDVPNSTNTYPAAMNATGDITGWYSDASGAVRGFVREGSNKTCTVSLTSNMNPAYVNQSVTLSAVVGGTQSMPTGSVTFKNGTSVLATVPLANGQASLTTAFTKAGSFSIIASYSGDQNYLGKNSKALKQVVKKYTTSTTLTSSPNPSAHGQPVTFTATVSSTGPIPTGRVVFKNGSTSLGGRVLVNGVASLTTSKLPVGTFSITAIYNGDIESDKSTSPILVQVVD